MTDPSEDTRIVLVSDALQARLDAVREQGPDRTATSITFDAVEHFRAELPALVRDARTRLASPGADPAEVRHLGAGPVQIRLRPGAAGARLLDRLSSELGEPWTVWIPAVLNAYLPGRREPDDMPWLVPTAPTPAGRLHRAADLLETLRERTTGGHWRTAGLLASRPEVVAQHDDGTTEHVAEARARTAGWIAALSPELAAPLASWLRATAYAAERGEVPPASLQAALRFATTLIERVEPPGDPRASVGTTPRLRDERGRGPRGGSRR